MGVAEEKGTPLGPSFIFFGPFLIQFKVGKKTIHPGNLEPFFICFFFFLMDFVSNFRDLFLVVSFTHQFPCDFIQAPEGPNKINYQSKL